MEKNLAEWVCNFVAFRTRKIEMKAGAKIVSLSVCRFATYSVQYMYSLVPNLNLDLHTLFTYCYTNYEFVYGSR